MNYILLHRSYGNVSTRRIVEKMEEPVMRLMKTKGGDWVVKDKENNNSPVQSILSIVTDLNNRIINWGNRIFGDGYDKYFALNRPSGIGRASDKAQARKIMQNAGIPVPRTWFANVNYDGTLPVIARPPYHHAGQHFHVLTTPDEYNNLASKYRFDLEGWYFSEIFDKTHEFRCHTAHGKITVMHEKPLIEGELRANHAINHEQWRALKWSEFIPAVSLAALHATEAVGLDYAAVDVMYNANNGNASVAEVNTSPEVTADYTSGKYAAYFDWVIRHGFPTHFKPEGTSVFYNNILRD